MKEVEKGFLEGPVCCSSLPPGSTLTKRLPVKQKNKVRPIDDYKASLVNFAVTQNEGVTIHTTDHIASMTACWMKSGNLSPQNPLVAKCWDLSDAYKQVPLSDNAFELDSYLAVYDPSSKDAYALWFHCVSHCIPQSLFSYMENRVVSSETDVVCIFDDFLCLSRESEAKHVDFCVSSISSLLGWKVSAHKLLPFASICKVLGVQLDLRQSGDSLCLVLLHPRELKN